MSKIDRKMKNKLLKELNSISSSLKFAQKRMISDYRDENYANINDVEYIFGDIDKYYAAILTSSLFDKCCQRYLFRGDKIHNMSVKSYFDKMLPYLSVLIDKNKVYEQKIQIDIGFSMINISNNCRIKFLFVPFNEENVCPEYISNRNFDKIDQVILLKISDGEGKWHFLALPSNLDEDKVKRPYKSLSRLMEGISSNSHGDFYCLGCFSSFRTKSTLKNHVDLCKNNKFAKIELAEEGSNFKR